MMADCGWRVAAMVLAAGCATLAAPARGPWPSKVSRADYELYLQYRERLLAAGLRP